MSCETQRPAPRSPHCHGLPLRHPFRGPMSNLRWLISLHSCLPQGECKLIGEVAIGHRFLLDACCTAATNLPGSHGTTRGSFHPPTPRIAGYRTPGRTCRKPSISASASISVASLTVPNSGVLTRPFGENSARNALAIPTSTTAAANKSERSVTARLMRIPPALVPRLVRCSGLVYPFAIRYSALEMKSFQVFGLVVLKPARYQASPFSLPPRTCA